MTDPPDPAYPQGKPPPRSVQHIYQPLAKWQVRFGPWTTTVAPVQPKIIGATLTPNIGSQPILVSQLDAPWYFGPNLFLIPHTGSRPMHTSLPDDPWHPGPNAVLTRRVHRPILAPLQAGPWDTRPKPVPIPSLDQSKRTAIGFAVRGDIIISMPMMSVPRGTSYSVTETIAGETSVLA